jgi:hypothetical protein
VNLKNNVIQRQPTETIVWTAVISLSLARQDLLLYFNKFNMETTQVVNIK